MSKTSIIDTSALKDKLTTVPLKWTNRSLN